MAGVCKTHDRVYMGDECEECRLDRTIAKVKMRLEQLQTDKDDLFDILSKLYEEDRSAFASLAKCPLPWGDPDLKTTKKTLGDIATAICAKNVKKLKRLLNVD